MVYKPKHRRLFAKSQGRDDPRHVSTAAKARAPELGSSNSRTGSVERRLLAFYTKYRPEKLLQVDDTLKRYSGREEELFAALVKKYGPEPAGPNYKSRNNSVRRKSHLANERLSEQMVRAYDRFLRDHHLVDIRDEEKVNERDEGESSFHDDTNASGYMNGYLKGYAGGKKAFWRKSRE